MMRAVLGAALAAVLLSIAPAMADDWTAQQLRGQVLQLIANQWQPLRRGDVVPDDRVIRTLGFGRVSFVRGAETIELGPNTQIQIHDRGGKKPFTTVTQYFGSVGVEAQVQSVQHFAVDTPFLAAVVKGTRFVVTSGKTGATVSVNRGRVAVGDRNTGQHVTISIGQSATMDMVKTGGNIDVAGSGALPVVLDKSDKPVVDDTPNPRIATAASGTLFPSPAAPPTTTLDDDGADKVEGTPGIAGVGAVGNSGKSRSDRDRKPGKGSSDGGGKSSKGRSDSSGKSGKGNSDDSGKPGKGNSDGSGKPGKGNSDGSGKPGRGSSDGGGKSGSGNGNGKGSSGKGNGGGNGKSNGNTGPGNSGPGNSGPGKSGLGKSGDGPSRRGGHDDD